MATFSVILIHVSASLVEKYEEIPIYDWLVANFYESISRYAVPMFFMISGALLLHKDYDLINFLKRRFGKVLPPFIIWSLIYSFSNRYVFGDDCFSLIKTVKDVFYGCKYHLWFIYVLLGIYLTVPILRRWIKKAPEKEILYVILIWIVTLILTIPKFKIYFPKIDLTYFSGFIGYFILGYYLSLLKIKRTIPIIAIVLGVSITFFGTYYFTVKNATLYYYFYEYLCLNTLLVSSGLFMLFNKVEFSSKTFCKVVSQMNKTCFGIYLMHPLLLKLFSLIGFDVSIGNPILSILLITLSCFMLCFILIYFTLKSKYGHLLA